MINNLINLFIFTEYNFSFIIIWIFKKKNNNLAQIYFDFDEKFLNF